MKLGNAFAKEKGISLIIKLGIIALILFLVLNEVGAQETAQYNNNMLSYKMGVELYEKQQFGAAQRAFSDAIEQIDDPNSDLRVNAEYYEALCALALFNKDAEFLFRRFIENHSENPKVRTAYFHLGKYKFRRRSYTKAIGWFNKVDIYDLTNKELSEYYFKLGYSYFVKKDVERARSLFYEIKDANTKYSTPAIYYYSHISYLNQDYETAMKGFQKLSTQGSFQHIVPYYIAQIYYMQKKHEELLKYALPLLDSANTKRAPEISRLIGEAYYATNKYKEAIPYLKRYMEEGHHAMRADLFQLGYAYYKSGQFEEAIKLLKQVVNTKDEMAQNAYYHLGDCYLKTEKKKYARYAFRSASKMDFSKDMQEDAAYNYAKLSYDLKLTPIFALNKYINTYPNSDKKDEAIEYLVKVYLSTNNYKRALKQLDKIENKSDKLKEAYQRIAYYRGVELFNDKKLNEAIASFDKSHTYVFDANIEALAFYWKGEAYYRSENYKRAIYNYDKFIYAHTSFSLVLFNEVNYNMGYAYFKQKDYENSNTWFRKFVRHDAPVFQRRRIIGGGYGIFSRAGDAHLRIGDGYFISNDFKTAIEYYNNAIDLVPDSIKDDKTRMIDADYAHFQKGLALGVLGRHNEKVGELHMLLKDFPTTIYTDDAKYELAKSYSDLEKVDSSISWYQKIIDEHPSSSYVKKCLLNMALEYNRKGESEIALVTFKRVIKDYPGSGESKDALVGLKNIYVEIGDVSVYLDYIKDLPFANTTIAHADSTIYEAAETVYLRGDCESAVRDFSEYLKKFSEGQFAINANFYRAECLSKIGDSASVTQSLKGYQYVLKGAADNPFTEKSMARSAAIMYERQDYENALEAYLMLEKIAEYKSNIIDARIGQMHCNFLLKDYQSAIDAAEIVMSSEKIAGDVITEAHFIIAKSSLETDDYNLALKEFSVTRERTHSEMGAAAQYYVAYIQYLRSEHDSSEQSIFRLAKRVPSYDTWIAKGFILLADNYVQIDNTFQAKATLQSVIDNSMDEDIIEQATEKLDKIKTKEAKNIKEVTDYKEIEIQFEDYKIEYDKLYDEEEFDEEDDIQGEEQKSGDNPPASLPDEKADGEDKTGEDDQ